MATTKAQQREESIHYLHGLLTPGQDVYTNLNKRDI